MNSQKSRILAFLCIAIMLFTRSLSAQFSGGSGTSADPYQIKTPADLNNVRNYFGNDKNFKLMNDLDLTSYLSAGQPGYNGGKLWLPIGTRVNPFKGTFDGNGKKILGFAINLSVNDAIGLFGCNGGTIKNIGVENATITGSLWNGVLCGWNDGVISKSYASGSLTASGNTVGGLVGQNEGSISNCYASTTVKGVDYVGGLVGHQMAGSIAKCYAIGAVSNTGNPANKGGLTGYSDRAVTDSYWDKNTTGMNTSYGSDPAYGKTTEQMKTQSTYANWDFVTFWRISPTVNNGYPHLTWEPFLGNGTALNPYLIENSQNLVKLADIVNEGNSYAGKYFKLTTLLDLGAIANWTPIGNSEATPFCGNFDGNNNRIINLNINNCSTAAGLFGVVKNGCQISNLTISNCQISGGSGSAGALAGILAVDVDDKVSAITNCHSSGRVTSSAADLGGLVGTVKSLAQTGTLNFTDCSSAVTVTCTQAVAHNLGGLVGNALGNPSVFIKLNSCFASGNLVNTEMAGKSGGLIGAATSVEVRDCYATGSITLKNSSETQAGGLIGTLQNSFVKSCYATGSILPLSGSVGGVIGAAAQYMMQNCYWDTEASGVTSDNGIGGAYGVTTAQMRNQQTFMGWDFMEETTYGSLDIWGLNPANNNGYPFLKWQGYEHYIKPFTDINAGLRPFAYSTAAWGDYDNDGDLDFVVSGDDNGVQTALIYRNDAGVFTDIQAGLTGVKNGSAAWGDYDRDGDLDLVLAGRSGTVQLTTIYRNDNGSFNDINAGLPGTANGKVSWGDYDNDGDLDLLMMGLSGNTSITAVYKNMYGNFSLVNAPLPEVANGSAAWGDYDNDGDLDILLTGVGSDGNYLSKIFRNAYGTFNDINAGLDGAWFSAAVWGDYDNDGDLDILLSGVHTSSATEINIYRNDKSNNGNLFVKTAINLPGVQDGSLAWGDYDNDGDLDLLHTGMTADGNIASTVYRNDNGVFTDINAELQGAASGSLAWGDYDADGDLDILSSGMNNTVNHTKIYRNNSKIKNTPPQAPADLSAAIVDDTIAFSWGQASDSTTVQKSLTYNLAISNNSSFASLKAAEADSVSGLQRLPAAGNCGQNNFFNFSGVYQLPPQSKISWSVQSVDNGFAGSKFTSGTPISLSDLALNNKAELSSTDTLFWQATDLTILNGYRVQISAKNDFSAILIDTLFTRADLINDDVNHQIALKLNRLGHQEILINGQNYWWRMKPVYSNVTADFSKTPGSFIYKGKFFAQGSGSIADPYLIGTAYELNNLRYFLGEQHKNLFFKLKNDIDLTAYLQAGAPGYNEGKFWQPIGEMFDPGNSKTFWATLKGAGHTIKGLKINRPYSNEIGLFGLVTDGGTIDSLGLIFADQDSILGKNGTGGLVGILSLGTVENCFVTGRVNGSQHVGIIVGVNDFGSVKNCYTFGSVRAYSYAGGIVGSNSGRTAFCYSVSSAIDSVGMYAGSILGTNNIGSNFGTVDSCYWDNEHFLRQNLYGTGKTTAQMKTKSTYTSAVTPDGNWNFNTLWKMDSAINSGYPSLKWQNTTAINEKELMPLESALYNNYPNPFNPSTTIRFDLKSAGSAKLVIYNAKGELVKTLLNGMQNPGRYSVNFNGAGLNSGVYFYKLETPNGTMVKKMTLIK